MRKRSKTELTAPMNSSKNFQTEFQKLNPAQREAAENIEGPLLVVAGPGTGKTQTLALRLANILTKTQARPHNLLALTFTESAAVALKKRLASVIGSAAYGVSAFTFHGFCARLHATFPAEFASTRERIQIDELRQFQLFREIFAKNSFEKIHPLGAPDLYLRDISSAISNLKREGITPARFLEILKKEKETLSMEERINPRTQKPFGKIISAEKSLAKNFELANFYENYQKNLAEKGFTDFDDLILTVVEKLNPSSQPAGELSDNFLLAYLQENFLYATVDEFQDTNGAQNAILQAWGSFDAQPNLCVVGDDDQSIYRFQGASLTNILNFEKTYKQPKIVVLTKNYRSSQKILDTASSVIQKNSERLVNKIPKLSKDLSAARDFSNPPKPKLIEAESEADEASFVLIEIQKMLAQKIPPEEIVIIYRKRRHGDVFADLLARKNIPFFRADGQNALNNFRVKQLLALLSFTANPNDSINLAKLLFADFTEIPELEAFRILQQIKRGDSFLEVLLSEDQPEIIQQFGKILLEFQKTKSSQNLLELAENIAAESGLTRQISEAKDFESAEALFAFLTFIRNFTITREEASLENLLADFDLMQKQGIALSLPARAHAAVTLTTAHNAKGLEWQNVFVVRLGDNDWGGRAKSENLKLPDLFPVESESLDKKQKLIEDERRLFFVALTRAKENLFLSYSATVFNGYRIAEVSPSRFLAEIPEVSVEKISAAKSDFAMLPLSGEKPLSLDSQKFLASLLENYQLSPTALNNYLACPRKFLFQNLLRLPTSVSVDDRLGAIFGSAVHQAFEDFFREFKTSQKIPPISIAITGLEKSLRREPLTSAQREKIKKDATSALEKYFAHHLPLISQPPAELEFNFARHQVRLDEIALTGKVDRIDAIPDTKNEVRFIDYKSMQPLTSAAIRGETANSTGDSYRQLLFYLLLAELDDRFIFQPREVALSFVRPDAKGDFHDEVFAPTGEEVEELKKKIRETWVRIQGLDFGCEEGGCGRCSFGGICRK